MVVIIVLRVFLWQFSFLLSPTPSICHRKFFLISGQKVLEKIITVVCSSLAATILLSQFSAATMLACWIRSTFSFMGKGITEIRACARQHPSSTQLQ
jgi:hypothetical protein